MSSLPTGTVTFLFTDIEGSTTLLQRLGNRLYAEVLDTHRRLLRDLFTEENGQEVDTPGDAFLAVFSRAKDAVGTAVSAQRALSTYSWPDGVSLRVRMGLHTGEPVSESRNYVGLDVHRAARICSAGHGGQILLSYTVGVLAGHDLPPGVNLRNLGSHRLKDLREPEHLFQVVHPDLTVNFPPLDSLDARPNNLPAQLTSFIGREREMADVGRLLSSTRCLTLTGTGGAGKTRLALQVAAEVLDEFPDGVWLVELAALSDPSLVPKAVASALDVPEQSGRMLIETLTDSLRGKSALVILDNCEHLVAACAHLIDALLRTCPNLRILATSREALGVMGETTWRVPSLSVPDPQNLPPLDRFTEYEAVRLFVDRAVASAPQFALTRSNAPAVAQVCHRLDGIPLAIELAAARVKVLAVEQIAARLGDRFRLLTGGSRTALPRQQTLRATMDWSYDLLGEKERTLLRRLSVFVGGWTLEAAEAICSGKGVEASDILDLLTHLVDKSLVLADVQGGEPRYRLLETVRQYGLAKLLEAGEVTDVRKQHRDWYLMLAEGTNPELQGREQGTWLWELQGPEQGAWLNRLEAEHDNLRAALEWSRKDTGGAEPGLLCEEGLLLGRDLKDRQLISTALANLGSVARLQGDYERAARFYRESYVLSREIGGKPYVAYALRNLGVLAHDQGNYQQAAKFYTESLTLSREVGNRWLSRECLEGLAWVASSHEHYEHSARLLGAAEAFRETLGLRLPPAYQAEHERRVASARAVLGEAVFRATWNEGRAMTLEQAIDYALASEDPRVQSDTRG